MTLIVGSAIGDTPDELYAAARAAAETVDWIEVRLDGPSGLPWDLRGFFSFSKPAIATVRHTIDGGRSGLDDAGRAALLRRAVLGGARGIDVEAWSDEAPTLVKEAHQHGAMVIVSRHFVDATPSEEHLVEMLREARAMGADVAKLATRIETPADAVALVRAAQRAQEEGIPYALMAVNDPVLRLLAPRMGMALVYASIPGAAPATSGQVPAPEIRRAYAAAPSGAIRAGGATRAAFLLGHPVAHSRSPAMQNAAFAAARVDGAFLALDVAPDRLGATIAGLKATNAFGCNVTMPHKEAALDHMDALDESARELGAVNTIVFRDGRAIGHNTDGEGAIDALREGGARLPGTRALVLGAGGAARAVAHALRKARADVTITNRTPARAATLGFPTIPWERIPDVMQNVDLLVNATSLGLHGEPVPAPLAKMLPGSVVFDLVYGQTPLMREASERGLLSIRGDGMLVHQGARAFTLWTGRPAPVAVMRAAMEGAS